MKKLIILLALLIAFIPLNYSDSLTMAHGFILNLPDEMRVEKKQDFISSFNQERVYRQIYSCQYKDRIFLLHIYCKIKPGKSLESISQRYDIPVLRAATQFGPDQLLEQILEESRAVALSDNFTSVYYTMGNGYRYGKNDMAAFFFSLRDHNYFDEVLVQINNIWMNQGDPIIERLDTEMVESEILRGNGKAELYGIFKKSFEGMKFITP